jgi:hypothetical protein
MEGVHIEIEEAVYKPSKVTIVFAKVISYLFHPLFIPTYIYLFLVYQFPMEFADTTELGMQLKLISVFFITAFLPAFSVFLLWKLDFSNSVFLRTQKERIIPFFISMFMYWWMFYLSGNMKDQPAVLRFFFFGLFAATPIGVIINNYIKISLHGMAMSAGLMAMILFAFHYQVNLGLPISIATIITGAVCSSRFIAGHHTIKRCTVACYWELFANCWAIGFLCKPSSSF